MGSWCRCVPLVPLCVPLTLPQSCPPHSLSFKQEAHKATLAVLDTRRLPYTAVPGTDDVRQACADFLNVVVMGGERVYGPEHVVVTNGAVQAVWDCLALSVEGPEVPASLHLHLPLIMSLCVCTADCTCGDDCGGRRAAKCYRSSARWRSLPLPAHPPPSPPASSHRFRTM